MVGRRPPVEEIDWWQEAKTTPMPVTRTVASFLRGLFDQCGPLGRIRDRGGGKRVLRRHRVAPFFSDIRQRLGPPELALLPIGAYEPQWFMKNLHMNPAEAVQAHLDLEAVQSVGMHFGTFQLTNEGIDDPPRVLEETRRARGIPEPNFRTLRFGESLNL